MSSSLANSEGDGITCGTLRFAATASADHRALWSAHVGSDRAAGDANLERSIRVSLPKDTGNVGALTSENRRFQQLNQFVHFDQEIHRDFNIRTDTKAGIGSRYMGNLRPLTITGSTAPHAHNSSSTGIRPPAPLVDEPSTCKASRIDHACAEMEN